MASGGSTLAEVMLRFAPADPHPESYDLLREALGLLEIAPADLSLVGGRVVPSGAPARALDLAEVARAARARELPLAATFYFEPPTVTWAYAAHAAIVEVDVETGRVAIERYVIAHDCGVLVNPMLAEGQIIGGAVQGIGGALAEAIAYDREGQLLSGTFMDYAMPIASDVPAIELVHQEIPSPLNPLGVKGLGEGGAISPPATLANAVCDALAPFGIELNATPIRPESLLREILK